MNKRSKPKFTRTRKAWSVEWYGGYMVKGGRGEIACERPRDADDIVRALNKIRASKTDGHKSSDAK